MGYGDGGAGGGGGRGSRGNNPTLGAQEAEDAQQEAAERNLIRKSVDFHAPAILDVTDRLYHKACRGAHVANSPYLQPHSSYLRLMGMPLASVGAPNVSTAFCTHLAHVTRAKNSTPVMCLSWTPGGRRLLTGNQEGEFSLWCGISFGFELIMSAHDTSFRSMAWSHNRNYLLTCDAGGNIKYWSPSIAPVQSIDSHNAQPIHALSFSPSDTKFVSCGDDATVRIWDWATHSEERILEGHGWDVKCVQWHPRSSVICSGSKDNLVRTQA
jgi:polyadenylation factor subunit 2